MSSPAENPAEIEAEIAENSENKQETENPENAENPEIYHEVPATVAPPPEPTRFKTKKIRFGPIDYLIVTQNLNGPCPLIAAINALILRGKLTIPTGDTVSLAELLNLLTLLILSREPPEGDENKAAFEANLKDVMNLMDGLPTGLNLNLKFSDVDAFEFTPAISLFDLVSLKLYHVWLPDPQFTVIYDLIKNETYNDVADKATAGPESDEKAFLVNFLNDTSSQITFHGLCTLMEKMKDGEIAVLFENNHFSTILKRRDEIFKLVSDEGYADKEYENIVWQTFNSIDGDCTFVDCDFRNFRPVPHQTTASSTVIRTSEVQEDDYEMAEEARETMTTSPAPSSQQAPPTSSTVTQARQSSTAERSSGKNCLIM